ncbi:hypothetical protein V6N12_034311 [Hibiscus sabdariffa]|uniref:Uncharacterized protein n=1 Tax=Hibiscus sabdariffa TaxID=183260 RepID=A0ABR2A0L6_9ROSI
MGVSAKRAKTKSKALRYHERSMPTSLTHLKSEDTYVAFPSDNYSTHDYTLAPAHTYALASPTPLATE